MLRCRDTKHGFLFLSSSKIERATPATTPTTTITPNKELSLAGGHAVLSSVGIASFGIWSIWCRITGRWIWHEFY